MNTTTIGTCSRCRGPVTVPSIWSGVVPPTPRCEQCGATPKNPHGPVIDMEATNRDAVLAVAGEGE